MWPLQEAPPLERDARAGRGGARELARKGGERAGWVCSCPRTGAWSVGGGTPVRAQGRGQPRRPLSGSAAGAGESPASGCFGSRPARTPRLDRAGCAGPRTAHTLGGPGRGNRQSLCPASATKRNRTSPSPPAPVWVGEARVGRPLAPGGPRREKRNFPGASSCGPGAVAAPGGVGVAGGGGRRHVGVCGKRGALGLLPSRWAGRGTSHRRRPAEPGESRARPGTAPPGECGDRREGPARASAGGSLRCLPQFSPLTAILFRTSTRISRWMTTKFYLSKCSLLILALLLTGVCLVNILEDFKISMSQIDFVSLLKQS
ncbi:translation initiation factor IF-2-like [Nycticebus coucang]|uniref:translation initiation factor IF-2-like n=1 Tax=Nycticebus coucang TaxID=9470 RepID=UPI00234DD8D9|nr:translation initiation factor IF-2-like [Nycticebus coucang]